MKLSGTVCLRPLILQIFVLGVGVLSIALPAQAQDDRAELTGQVIALLKEEAFLERHIEQTMRMVPPDQRENAEEIAARLDVDEIYSGLAEAIEERYTSRELEAYLKFASTDEGRSIIRKQAEIDVVMRELAALAVLKAVAEE